MIHRAGKIGIRESNAPKWSAPQHFSWRRLSIFTKKEARLRIHVGVAPAIQNDSGDVALGIKTSPAKHRCELVADPLFVIAKRSAEHLCASAVPLFFGRQPGIRIQNFYGEDDGRV